MFLFLSNALANIEPQTAAPIIAAQLSPPTDLKVEHLGSSAALSWTPVSKNNSKERLGYVIFKGESALGPWAVEDTILPFDSNSFEDSHIDSETTYCYRIATLPQDTPTDDFSILWDTLLNYGSISSTVCAPPKPSSNLPLFAGIFVLFGGMIVYGYRRSLESS